MDEFVGSMVRQKMDYSKQTAIKDTFSFCLGVSVTVSLLSNAHSEFEFDKCEIS